VSDNPYAQVAYRTFPRRQTHPDRLAAIARLFGMKSAPVAACRVLEIGCGNGANLIPLAYYLPQSRFTGIDLAASPITAARAMAGELGLQNIDLRVADLRDLGAEEGEFDYIFAHGLYSWDPGGRARPPAGRLPRTPGAPGRGVRQLQRVSRPVPAPDDPRDPVVSHASAR
jgi:SAM-dependent methyltransferase